MSPRLPAVTAATLAGLALASAPAARAQRWQDATADTIGTTAQWTNKVELADVDGDGRVDILLANGGDYAEAGTPEPQRVFRNTGDFDGPAAAFTEISAAVFGGAGTRLSRVIEARDLDGDDDIDLFVGGAHGTASALFVNDGAGAFTDASSQLPAGPLFLGDAEAGDVDGDGDLDLVLADWGGPPFDAGAPGGQTRLWLNDGAGTFSDATAARLPVDLVGMSWDLDLVDVDDDADLDVLVSCKLCTGGRLYANDGAGTFTNVTAGRLPQADNNYDYEAMDLDGDGDLDLMTINDGAQLRETILINDDGTFTDETATRLPGAANVSNSDDNVVVFLDVDADGDADALIGSLNAADRLLVNDGAGVFTLDSAAITLSTPGTLGLGLADLDGDGRLDVVNGQGEVASPDKVLLATAEVAVDTAAPVVRILRGARADDLAVVARAHDRKSPSAAHDWRRVEVELIPGGGGTAPNVELAWRGEYLWAGALPDSVLDDAGLTYRVCATDAAGNVGCSDARPVAEPGTPDAGPGPGEPDAGDGPAPDGDGDGDGGCGCRTAGRGDPAGAAGALALLLVVAGGLLARRRRVR